MKKIILISGVALFACGCSAYQRGYRAGYSSGQYQYGWHDGYAKARGRGLEDKVRDLEMENAALRAANEELLKGYPAFK